MGVRNRQNSLSDRFIRFMSLPQSAIRIPATEDGQGLWKSGLNMTAHTFTAGPLQMRPKWLKAQPSSIVIHQRDSMRAEHDDLNVYAPPPVITMFPVLLRFTGTLRQGFW